jgi:hypothetical protein
MTAQPYQPPRGPDGKILIGPLFDAKALEDERPAEPVLQTSKVGEAPPPPRKRTGELPTPFGQQQAPKPATAPAWQTWAAYGVAGLIVALGVGVLLRQEAPAAPPAAPPTAAITTPATEAPGIELPRPRLTRAVVAFAEPGGAPVGALEPGRPVLTVEERDGWRLLDAEGSGTVWVRAWEMDGIGPPTPTPQPTAAPTVAPRPAPAVVVPVGPAVTCVPVVDGDNGNAYLGDACGATSAERQARALELLQQAGR